MKKIVLVMAAALVATVAPTTAANADTPRCVTRAEYRAVHTGFSKARVAGVFDTAGKREILARRGRFTSEIRSYRTCSKYSVVSISFGNGRLEAKSAVWVS